MLPVIIGKQTKSKFITNNGVVGVAVQALTTEPFDVSHSVTIEATAGNTDTIYVGENNQVAVGSGWPLTAGEKVEIPIDDARKIYVIGGAATQAYKWLAI